MRPRQPLSQIIALLFVGAPTFFLLALLVTRQIQQAALALGLYLIAMPIATLAIKVLEDLNVRIADRIADAIYRQLSLLLSDYEGKYKEHLIFRYRDFAWCPISI